MGVAFAFWLGGVVVGGVGAILMPRPIDTTSSRRLSFAWGSLFLGALFCGLLAPAGLGVCNSVSRMKTTLNLQQITLAMHSHADMHGNKRFPAAILRDPRGKPVLSWRVAILPCLGEQALYDQFHLDEPWDSPHNVALLTQMPEVYKAVRPDVAPPGTTRFQVFVGPGTPFEIEEGPRFPDDFPDPPGGTLLVVEALDPVPWTKPADLTYHHDLPLPQLGAWGTPPEQGYFSVHRGWLCASCADGSVRYLSFDPVRSERQIRQGIVRNDGKGVED